MDIRITVVICVVIFFGQQQVSALKHIDVKLLTFNNFGHKKMTGGDCDIGRNFRKPQDYYCEPIFTLCLDQIDIPAASTIDPQQCINAITSMKGNGAFNIHDTEEEELILWDHEHLSGLPNPLSASTERKGNIALKVLVEDLDASPLEGGNEIMDEMYTQLTQTPTTNGTVNHWVGLTLVGARTKVEPSHLKLKYRVYCAVDYYGSDCETFCRPVDNSHGHYTCDDEGGKICHSGWESPEANCLLSSGSDGSLSWSEIVLIVVCCLLVPCFITVIVLACRLKEARRAAKLKDSLNKRCSASDLDLDNIWTFPPPYTVHSSTHHNTTGDNRQADLMY